MEIYSHGPEGNDLLLHEKIFKMSEDLINESLLHTHFHPDRRFLFFLLAVWLHGFRASLNSC